MNTVQLQTEILGAHEEVKGGSPGARKKLERLQAEYRSGRHEIVRDGGSCQLVERDSSTTPQTTSRPRRRPLERSTSTSPSRPYWQLTEREPESWRLR
jgi:hypothetical protein